MNTPAAQRIVSLDAIRGLAIFGILLANIQSWSGYRFIELALIPSLTGSAFDDILYVIYSWVVSAKFYTIFCVLFGASFAIQNDKEREDRSVWLATYRRRMFWLLIFGLCHTFIWSGDILTLYALLAFVLMAIPRFSVKTQALISAGLLCLYAIPATIMLYMAPGYPLVEEIAHKTYPNKTPAEVVAVLKHGGFVEYMQLNLHNVYWRWFDLLPDGRISRLLGLFMLGALLLRTGYFLNWGGRWSMIFGSLVTGVATISIAKFFGGTAGAHWPTDFSQIIAKGFMTIGQIGMAAFYMGVVIRCTNQGWLKIPLNWFATIGRTAFTCYLGQTIIGLIIFSVFNLAGEYGLGALWLIALGIYATQVIVINLWLRVYKMGPLEWFWRCLAEKRRLPLKRNK